VRDKSQGGRPRKEYKERLKRSIQEKYPFLFFFGVIEKEEFFNLENPKK
jgi:hypothetical protein